MGRVEEKQRGYEYEPKAPKITTKLNSLIITSAAEFISVQYVSRITTASETALGVRTVLSAASVICQTFVHI